tara:strand:+ start:155 stop:613 length:459 start_codon:yes stop_codon:yes gene_type:complete
MKKILTNKYLLLIFRLCLGLIFIYASIDKIIDPRTFSNLIDNYHITPHFLNNLFALFIPWMELIIGIGIITKIYYHSSLQILILLLIWFTFILAQAVLRGIDTHCGCFKTSVEETNEINYQGLLIKRIIEDVILLFMAIILKFEQYIKNKLN